MMVESFKMHGAQRYVGCPGSPGQHPHVTDENKVIKDIECWKNQVTIPSLDGLDWSVAIDVKKNGRW